MVTCHLKHEYQEEKEEYLPKIIENIRLIIIVIAVGLSGWVIGDTLWEYFFKNF